MKRMQKWWAGLAGLAMAALLQSAPLAIAAEGAAPDFQPPPESELPEGPFGEVVRQGRAVFMDTARMMPDHVGNVLSCANCHMDRGRLADAAPMWAAIGMYPAYRRKNDKVNSFTERIQGCFQFSMNGTPPDTDDPMLVALISYMYWLATGAPMGVELAGRGYPEGEQPEGGYDLARGEQVYAEQCALCHGEDGQGQSVAGDYVFPPLWGPQSYNWGAGMHRINTAAAFIQANMPLGKGGTLTRQQAWDVAAWINSHERPQDPRLVNGSVEETRLRFHAEDGVNLYGQEVNGVVLGQGTE